MKKNYRSIRSNKILKNNYIYSIYYKGKIRENRINRKFDSEMPLHRRLSNTITSTIVSMLAGKKKKMPMLEIVSIHLLKWDLYPVLWLDY